MRRLVILALVLAACASPAGTFTQPIDIYNPPATYVYYNDAIYADLFWRCRDHERGGVHVDGYAVSSLRNATGLLNFEIRLIARGAKGEILAEGWTFGDRLSAADSEPVPFAVSVAAAGAAVRYDLYYAFVAAGESGRGGHSGLSYFGTIEDGCGPQWRRRDTPPVS